MFRRGRPPTNDDDDDDNDNDDASLARLGRFFFAFVSRVAIDLRMTSHLDSRFPNRQSAHTRANMPSMVILGLRAVQLVFAIIIMGLSAYVANWYNVDTLTSSPSQINWLLFSSIYTMISVAYLELAPRFMPKGSCAHLQATLPERVEAISTRRRRLYFFV